MDTPSESSTIAALRKAVAGDRSGLDELLVRYRDRLQRMVRVRMDRRLAGRIDASDVIQESFVEATQRLPEYVSDPEMPFFLWLRYLTGQKLAGLHRHHLGVQARDAGREVRRVAPPEASAESMSVAFVGSETSPSAAAVREELAQRVRTTLEAMSAQDREILALRHFEQLTNAEASAELGVDVSTASKRYTRALARLREKLEGFPGATGD